MRCRAWLCMAAPLRLSGALEGGLHCASLHDPQVPDGQLDAIIACDGFERALLGWAAAAGNEACVSCLLDRRASVDAPNALGGTPLLIACQQNQVECARQLLRARAAVDHAMTNGETALYKASRLEQMALP